MSIKKPPPGITRRKKHGFVDPNQIEFGIIWRPLRYPFRLRAGDVFRFNGRLCRVVRVNECSAVVIMNRPVRVFKTRFDKLVRFQPPPALFRISPQSEVTILNRKVVR
jgi:hypothetical protein